jgi:polyhydroxyalkanoate synthase
MQQTRNPDIIPVMVQDLIKGMTEQAAVPRPLALHLAVQNLMFASSFSAWPSLKDGSLVWKDSLNPQARSLREKLQNVDAGAFAEALGQEIKSRIERFAEGVNRFSSAARPPAMPPLPEIWREGTTRLIHAAPKGGGNASPVILIPSLVNRAYILDLDPGHSLLRYLASHDHDRGHDSYLVDWDAPGVTETAFGIDHYVDRLERIRDEVHARTGQAPVIAGYCMGGNLALALARRDPAKIRAMALLATPWDFYAMPASATEMLAAMLPGLRQLIAVCGNLPVDVIQAMFSSRDPGGVIRKFRRFAALKPDSAEARAFVILEDWLNDGVPLTGPVALECLDDWYVQNRPMRGTWQSGGSALDVTKLDVPALVVIPDHDTIVPPASARPLAEQLPRATLVTANAGHIGMVAGSKAVVTLYEPLSDWIAALQ